MYQKVFNSHSPGCIVFLVDRSHSMQNPWSVGGTLARGAATALNRTLDNLVTAATPSGRTKHYFDVGVFGYGLCPSTGQQGVESALGGALAGRALVAIPELAENLLRVDEEPAAGGGPPIPVPVWVDPVAGKNTPMCEAISVAGSFVHEWAQRNKGSHPPIVINITDGEVKDSPHEGATIEQWADRLRSIATDDGETLLFNIFLSEKRGQSVEFPTTDAGLPAPGPQMFGMSSPLPGRFVEIANEKGVQVQNGGRAFCFNADFAMLQRFLDIGTPV